MFYKRLANAPILLASVVIIAGYVSCIVELASPIV